MKLTEAKKLCAGDKLAGIAECNTIRIRNVLQFQPGNFPGAWRLIIRDIQNNIWSFTQNDHDVFIC